MHVLHPFLPLVLALLLPWAARADEQALAPLGLSKGSLIECIRFQRSHMVADPSEDCIVLTENRAGSVEAVAVYTRGDSVLAWSASQGAVLLAGTGPTDINHRSKLDRAVRDAFRDRPASDAKPPSNQLNAAAAAVAAFPSAVSDIDWQAPSRTGQTTRRRMRAVVFDWAERHFAWCPEYGTQEFQVPRDPLTRSPYLCIEYPEMPESIRFASEYPRVHPDEKVAVLVNPRAGDTEVYREAFAVAAYTLEGKVLLHTAYGNLPLERASAADFGDPTRLAAMAFPVYEAYLRSNDTRQKRLFPWALPGDTAEMQSKRAHHRLQAHAHLSDAARFAPVLVLEWEDLQYAYMPKGTIGSGFLGRNPRYPALLIGGIAFADEYRRSHPSEKVVVLAHPPKSRATYPAGRVNAHVYFTKDEQLWGHLIEDNVGDYRVADASAADIENRGKLEGLFFNDTAADAAMDRHRDALYAEWKKNRGRDPKARSYDPAPFSPESVCTTLARANVPCLLVPRRSRSLDGTVIQYRDQAVYFRWEGVDYVYEDNQVFRARASGYPERASLELKGEG